MKISIIKFNDDELRADMDDILLKVRAMEMNIFNMRDNPMLEERIEATEHSRDELLSENLDLVLRFMNEVKDEEYKAVITHDIPVIDFDMKAFSDSASDWMMKIGEPGAYVYMDAPDGSGFALTYLTEPFTNDDSRLGFMAIGELFSVASKMKMFEDFRNNLPDNVEAIEMPDGPLGDLLKGILGKLHDEGGHDCGSCDAYDECDLPIKKPLDDL